MNVTVFGTQPFERSFLEQANAGRHHLRLLEARLGANSAALAQGSLAVSVFTADDASAPRLEELWDHGVRYLLVRAAGYSNVDLEAAHRLGLRVAHVANYSPDATAEYAVALILALCRHLRQADLQVRANDFSQDGLIGFNLRGKTVGILGVGHIGAAVGRILRGFGCTVLGYDVHPDEEQARQDGLRYVALPKLCALADIISVHMPLNDQTAHLLNEPLLAAMKPGVMLINTGRGGVLDTEAALRALDSGHLGYLGLDVYEGERALFFANHALDELRDKTFARLLTFKNVLVTGHQAYLTREALTALADATVASFDVWDQGQAAANEL